MKTFASVSVHIYDEPITVVLTNSHGLDVAHVAIGSGSGSPSLVFVDPAVADALAAACHEAAALLCGEAGAS